MSTLANIVANPRSGSFTSARCYRKYAAVLTTETLVAGVPDRSDRRILYEVGVRLPTKTAALAPTPADVLCTSTAYPTGEVMSDLFSGLARKFSNFSSSFASGNLAGVVTRVARGLAADSAYTEGVTGRDLLGGLPLRVHALGALFSPVSASMETVFIPRVVDTSLAPDTFAVLAHAVCGEGGIVATDMLELDANDRAPMVPDVDEFAFSPAAVDALRLLGANMAASGQGELFAVSLVKGLNDVLSVVGHTDEGGLMRDILRASAASSPFGGVHVGLLDYAGLPALATGDGVVVAGYVDALLLSAAGLVCHCDPGATVNGSWLPTLLTAAREGTPRLEAGSDTPPEDWMSRTNKSALGRVFDRYAVTYAAGLARLFGLNAEGGAGAGLLRNGLQNLDPACRHLRYPVVAPFFWVEPTSLIPATFLGTIAESEGFASVATRHEWRQIPLWEAAARTGQSSEHASQFVARFRGARACGYVLHFHGHQRDGMAFVRPMQLDPEAVALPGPLPDATVRESVTAGRHLGEYLWTRGQSPIAAPAELLNLGGTMGLRVTHFGLDDDGYPTHNHTPTADEIVGGHVRATVTGLVGVTEGVLTEATRSARRARTNAATALAAAVANLARYAGAVDTGMPVLLTSPSLAGFGLVPAAHGDAIAASRGPAPSQAAAAAHDANEAEPSGGKPVTAHVSHGAVTGPQVTAGRPPGVASAPATAARRAPPADAISVTSGDGAPPAPPMSTAGAAPPQRAAAE